MKLRILTLVFTMVSGYCAMAQIHPRVLGVRFGGGSMGSAEFSYQQGLSEVTRLELDLGWGGNSHVTTLNIVGIYHWWWNIDGGLNWYVGPGAALGLHSYDNDPGYINVAIGGQIGLEYDLSVKERPFLVSVDVRPMWDFLGKNNGLGWGSSIGFRYIF